MIKDVQLAPQSLVAMELFRGLPSPALEAVAACACVRRLPKEVSIFNQGDDGVRAHAVIEGGVRIAQSGSDGARVVIRFIGPGEMFGTVALFTDGRYPADAVTLGETLEASWSEAELLELMDPIRRLPSTLSASSVSACRRSRTASASSPPNAPSGGWPTPCCGLPARPGTPRWMERRSSSRYGARMWPTSPARRSTPQAGS